MGSTSQGSNRVADIRRDLVHAAFAVSHGIRPEDINLIDDAPGLSELDDAFDKVFLDHDIIDFDRHFPHTHIEDRSLPLGLCTYTAPTGEMCQEPMP